MGRHSSPRSTSGRSTLSDDTSTTTDYPPSVAPSSVSSRRVPFPEASATTSAAATPPHQTSAGRHHHHRNTQELLREVDTPPTSTTSSRATAPSHVPSVPTEPMPDSLLTRSTFAALEHSAGTLKRLTKHILAASSAMFAVLDQLDTAEDDLLMHLGELGRWLEGGYGVTGDVWDSDGGFRKVAREKRTRDREELEAMVSHSLEAVKGEIKRQGLAGHGAQAKFESVAKQYYQQTQAYLAPAGGSSSSPLPETDLAQASRTAQFDLVRYNHHSTLLYAVAPSSVGCLDLLVGLYGWVGAQLSHVPGKRADTHPLVSASADDFSGTHELSTAAAPGPMTPTQRGRQLAVSETPVRLLSRDDASARTSVDALTRTLALSLGHLVQVRGDLLIGWAERDHQTTLLEDKARSLAEQVPESNRLYMIPSSSQTTPDGGAGHHNGTPGTAAAAKARKMKLHSSVGGKIRGLFGSSSSSSAAAAATLPPSPLPTLAERAPPVSSSSIPPPQTPRTGTGVTAAAEVRPPVPAAPSALANSRKSVDLNKTSPKASSKCADDPVVPPRPSKSTARPDASHRHSVQVPQGQYHSPFIPTEGMPELPQLPPPPRSRSFGERKSYALQETTARLNGNAWPNVGAVGGLNGDGDEDEQREQVGRKKEGVLWGTGTWEELDKGGGRSKWERFWVVLSHSKIYESRGKQDGGAAMVIDLKFASVREGRGTDRRFAFEIVTPSHGRRLYQAASEADMKTWIYAICNAIESCINGTSTMRSTDFKDAGFLMDDYGNRKPKAGGDRRLPPPPPPLPKSNGAATGGDSATCAVNMRHSMPAPPRSDDATRRPRRTSFKSRIKSTAEAAGDKLKPNRQSVGVSVGPSERLAFLAQGVRMPSHPSLSPSPSSSDKRMSWREESAESEIEKRVMEMAGLGLDRGDAGSSGQRPGGVNADPTVTSANSNTVAAASAATTTARRDREPASPALPVRLYEANPSPALDMKLLRQIADQGPNALCADCGRRTKRSRWATQSLRDVPMVMFLCIRCCGVHRGLGTHISKPRSVELDNWSPDAVQLAHQWGNTRGNAVWERLKPANIVPKDEDIGDYIRAKYVEGRWLSDADRSMFGLAVGRAL